jgi:hypothetical protein
VSTVGSGSFASGSERIVIIDLPRHCSLAHFNGPTPHVAYSAAMPRGRAVDDAVDDRGPLEHVRLIRTDQRR